MRNKKLDVCWTKHIRDEEQKNNFISTILASTAMQERLIELLEEKLENSSKENEVDYESPSWAYKQADKLGYQRALREIINIIPDPRRQ